MNKLLIFALFVLIFFQHPAGAALHKHSQSGSSVMCTKQLQPYVNKIQKIPEARELIAFIQSEGPIHIVNANTQVSDQFGAFWDPTKRIICIALSQNRTEGEIIGSILFELHNASVNTQFDHLDTLAAKREIDQASYVRSMEHLEYINSLNAANLAEKGIMMGVLPKNARLPTYPCFQEHFAMQQQSGHSAHFERNYQWISQQGSL